MGSTIVPRSLGSILMSFQLTCCKQSYALRNVMEENNVYGVYSTVNAIDSCSLLFINDSVDEDVVVAKSDD